MNSRLFCFILLVILNLNILSTDLYFCTAANSCYFNHLINLIGSIHKTNYDHLQEIAVFNLGLTESELSYLKTIEKVKLYEIEKTHPDILNYFCLPTGKYVLGWYAWKAVAIKQALEHMPYLLWLDAGSTVLKELDNLFEYIKSNGYFLATIGSDNEIDKPAYPVSWGTTKFIEQKFKLDSPQLNWILSKDFIMANTIGVARSAKDLFITPLYEYSKDLRNFQDDGTTPNGWGTARHDQTLLSILGYWQNLTVFRQDFTQKNPIILEFDNHKIEFYITWNGSYVNERTYIYNSRWDLSNIENNRSFIRFSHLDQLESQ